MILVVQIEIEIWGVSFKERGGKGKLQIHNHAQRPRFQSPRLSRVFIVRIEKGSLIPPHFPRHTKIPFATGNAEELSPNPGEKGRELEQLGFNQAGLG